MKVTAIFVVAASMLAFDIAASPIRVTATLVSSDRKAIVDATVTISAGLKVLRKDEPVLNSRIALPLDTDSPSLTLDISATGYKPRRVNVDVQDGVAAVGTIALQPIPGIALGKIVYYHPPRSRSEILDVVVRNEDPTNHAQIVAVEVDGTKRATTECFDTATPIVEFDLTDGGQYGKTKDADMSLTVRVRDSQPSTLAARGRVAFLPCEQVRLHTRIDYPMGLSAGEQQKLRLELPAISRSGSKQILGLDAWQQLQVSVTLQDGRTFTTREVQNPRKP
jgi:hypothetical protein